ncbi:MAG: H-NS histone family protein [Methylomonas sp.]|nr:H-NS histone family protein [Methylomonas sp.]PPD21956.1 MAG: histone [Methylomonas sp.]PPD25738.1 MAG: histone [Methylomonas sp.]PPD36991.1 MAG: histone [Methylomonas sp.]PPD39107.1 MAG: histone [Methylomonas sp.]
MTDFTNLSENEIQSLIESAERALKEKQTGKRKEVIAQIKELAASIGVTIEIIDTDKKTVERRQGKVSAKYRNPNDPSQIWTGRGLAPRWMRDLLAAGKTKADFEIQ